MASAATAIVGTARRLTVPARWQNLGQSHGALGALLILLIYNAFFTRNFLNIQTLNVNLTQVATIAICATGMTLVIATGGIDLSVGSMMAISGALAPLIFLNTSGPLADPLIGVVAAFTLPLLVTMCFGLFNGALIAGLKIQPIIATLVLFIAGRGIAQVVTNGNLQPFRNPTFQYIGLGRPLNVPFQAILMLVVVLVVWWIMRRTAFGRFVLAVGGNENAARLAGVRVGRVKLAVYAISAVLAGIAGFIVISINSSSDANLVGQNMELDAIAATAVGGTPLTGGRATVIGTLIGALIMQLIRFTLLAHGIPDAVALTVKAVIIVAAVWLQRPQASGS
ncbi:MAG TPA: ABC transporter permease [Chloroflexota bacterium]|nr:ABC transporter permease [Chloroflexota bacterium]